MIATNSTPCCQVNIYMGKRKNKKYHVVDTLPRVSNIPEQILEGKILEMRLNGRVDHAKLSFNSLLLLLFVAFFFFFNQFSDFSKQNKCIPFLSGQKHL